MFVIGVGEDGQVRGAENTASHLNLDIAGVFFQPECPDIRCFMTRFLHGFPLIFFFHIVFVPSKLSLQINHPFLVFKDVRES